MSAGEVRGTVYVCPVCGAAVTVLAHAHGGAFDPHCCNVAMKPRERRLRFYVCPVCGAKLALIREGGGVLDPRCCNVAMAPEAA